MRFQEANGRDALRSRQRSARAARAPAALECRCHTTLAFGPQRELVIGEVKHLHARPGIVDPETLHVDRGDYRPVGRLFANWRSSEVFSLARETCAEWQARQPEET